MPREESHQGTTCPLRLCRFPCEQPQPHSKSQEGESGHLIRITAGSKGMLCVAGAQSSGRIIERAHHPRRHRPREGKKQIRRCGAEKHRPTPPRTPISTSGSRRVP